MSRSQSHGDVPQDRQIYVVRFWRAADGTGWLGQLHDVAIGETLAFASEDDLLAHLRDRLSNLRPPQREKSMQSRLK